MSADPIAAVWQTCKDFYMEARVVLRHPWSFPERLGLASDNLFGKGTAFLVLSTAVAYLLCIPIFLAHDMAVSKGVMVLLRIVGLYGFGLALHLVLKLLGSRGVTLKETLGLYILPSGQVYGYAVKMGSQPLTAYIDEYNTGFCQKDYGDGESFRIDFASYRTEPGINSGKRPSNRKK